MTFLKAVEFDCDHCGQTDYYYGGSIIKAKKFFKRNGSIMYKGKWFCGEFCFDDYIYKQKTKNF